jgi:hypothetical protein
MKGENVMNKIKTAILIAILALFLTGCGDGNEPDAQGYVVAIGIDAPENGGEGYDFTLQFANPSKISGGSGESGGKGGKDRKRRGDHLLPRRRSAL